MGVMRKRDIDEAPMTTPEMELCLVNPWRGAFPFTRYLVLPRSRWGIRGIYHECDMLALTRAGVLHEIEIKISRSDLRADKRKRHTHHSDIIKRLWFAVPHSMHEFALEHIPKEAGLVLVSRVRCDVVRRPKFSGRDKPDKDTIEHMYELLSTRYWSERIRMFSRK